MPTTPETDTRPAALGSWASTLRERLDAWLGARLDVDGHWATGAAPATRIALEPLREALAYSALAPGKRFRPLVVAAAGHACNAAESALLPVAAAVELVHAYSLVHDDLPAMDDDDLRRGRPTNHRVYGEATAILVGDGLQSEAFHVLSDVPVAAELRVQMVTLLARASGSAGMVGGQYLDIAGHDQVRRVHLLKTGRLIGASAGLGAIAGAARQDTVEALVAFGHELGALFQTVDDLLDDTAAEHQTGKSAGSDARLGRMTSVSRGGVDAARELATQTRARSLDLLAGVDGDTSRLRELVEYTYERAR